MKAYRALTGDAIRGRELFFLDSIQKKYHYKSSLWVRSNDIRLLSGVHVKAEERGHLFVNPENKKWSYIVYNADQMQNKDLIEKEFKKLRGSSMYTESQPLIRGQKEEQNEPDVDEEYEKFMQKLRSL